MSVAGNSAEFSQCLLYRYRLTREFAIGPRRVAFCMLNPSTADATNDDPTIRRCIRFARAWGFDRLTIVNAYAFRATDPKEMKRAIDPIGPDNDTAIAYAVAESEFVVAAWGANASRERAAAVRKMLGAKARVLRLTKDGAPGHPLYLPGDLEPKSW